MGSLDANSFFTIASVDALIDTCTDNIHNQQNIIEGINKYEFQNFLSLATKKCILFLTRFYINKKKLSCNGISPGSKVSICLSFFMKENGFKNEFSNLNQFL